MIDNVKWFGRSRQVWTIVSVALFACTGAARQLGLDLPLGLEESIDGLAQAAIGLLAAGLSTWSLFRPDNATLTLLPGPSHTPIGRTNLAKGASSSGLLVLLFLYLQAAPATALELVPAVEPHDFGYHWTPGAQATHYEVQEEVYGFGTLVTEQGLLGMVRSVVADPYTFVTPEVGEQRRIRVRGMRGAAKTTGDCPFAECGPWSEWSDSLVGRVNAPDLDGDRVVAAGDYIVMSRYWGHCVDGWRLRPMGECSWQRPRVIKEEISK